MNYKEPLLKFDNFLNPYISRDGEAISTLLIRLILLDPGTIMSEPDCGVGLVRNWRYCSEKDLPRLEELIKNQINRYLPDLSFINIKLSYNKNKELIFNIIIDDSIYTLRTDKEFNELHLKDIVRTNNNF